jgi:hypothetical protein
MMSKVLNGFYAKCDEAKVNRWRYNIEVITAHVSNLTDKEFKSLVSDAEWIRYPSYTYADSKDHRGYGSAISALVRHLCLYNEAAKDILVKHSKGLFLCWVIDSTSGKDRLKACSRAMKSKDTRARLRAAKLIPISKAKTLLKDSNSSVRNAVVRRIGIDNCASELVDDKSYWLRVMSIDSVDMNSDDAVSRIESILNKSWNSYSSWEVLALLRKVSDDALLYMLELSEKDNRYADYIRNRINYSKVNIGEKL